MPDRTNYDVIIIGGSFAGLSAAMALGRALRNVLIIDSGWPCNRQTPHSHNFITQDGNKPGEVGDKARSQVLKYPSIKLLNELAVSGQLTASLSDDQSAGFIIRTESGQEFKAKKLIFASGVKDIMPGIPGFSECWGISVVHCPYCHGYEVKHEKTGILANGDIAFHYARLLRNWTKDLIIFTNGKSTLSQEQTNKLRNHNISIIENEIEHLNHENGKLKEIVFKDNSAFPLGVLYSRPDFEQHCNIPETLGCERTEQGFIKVDAFHNTTVPNVFACGDNTSPMRSIANAVAAGNLTGAMVNNVLTEEEF